VDSPSVPGVGHTIEATLEAGWGLSCKLVCHFDPSDSDRPCWPHTEYGEPYSQEKGQASGCVYYDWFGEEGWEATVGPDKVLRFSLAEAKWDGDHFTFQVGDLLPSSSDDFRPEGDDA
jgi:hypothetical protein